MNKKSGSGRHADLAIPQSSVYLNRELSQLAFNRRVLSQAENPDVPLLERLRYLCIVSSNLDEFFEVRIASLLAQGRIDGETTESPELTAALERTSIDCHQVVEKQYSILNDEILPQLSQHGQIVSVREPPVERGPDRREPDVRRPEAAHVRRLVVDLHLVRLACLNGMVCPVQMPAIVRARHA